MRGTRQVGVRKYATTVKKGNLKQKARKAIKRSIERDAQWLNDYYTGHFVGPGERDLGGGIILVEGLYRSYQELKAAPFCSVCGFVFQRSSKEECFCERHGWFK